MSGGEGRVDKGSVQVIDISSDSETDDECQIVTPVKLWKPEGEGGGDVLHNPKSERASSSSESEGGNAGTGADEDATRKEKEPSVEEVNLVSDDDEEAEAGVGDEDDDLQILETGTGHSVAVISCESSSAKLIGSGEDGAKAPEPKMGKDLDGLGSSDADYVKRSDELLTAFGNRLLSVKPPKGTKVAQIEKGYSRVVDAYNKIKSLPQAVHILIQEELQHANQSLEVDPNRLWMILSNLLKKLEPEEITKMADLPLSVREQVREEQKQELLRQAERKLEKINKKVKELEEVEVDWDDEENEHNSSYIMMEKGRNKLVDAYHKICDASGCSHVTGRPVQKTINLSKHGASSGYAAVDVEVEKFVNSRGSLFTPDFGNILEIVKRVNETEVLGLTADKVSGLAQKVFESVARIIKMRRRKDSAMSMLYHCPTGGEKVEVEGDLRVAEILQDPAQENPDLKRKLEENDALRKSENEVIEKFVKLAQTPGGEGEVAEENPDESPLLSDSDSGDEVEVADRENEEEEGSDTRAKENAADRADEKDDKKSIPSDNVSGKRKNSETEEASSIHNPGNVEVPPLKKIKSDENSKLE